MITFTVFDNVYHSNLIVCVGTRDAYVDYVKKLVGYEDDVDPYSHGRYIRLKSDAVGKMKHVLWMSKLTMTAEFISLLVHEVSHHVDTVFYDNDIKHDLLNNEPYAYYLQFFVNSILTQYKKERKSQ